MFMIISLGILSGCVSDNTSNETKEQSKTAEQSKDDARSKKSEDTVSDSSKENKVFPKFDGKDFDENKVDNTVFSKSKLTVVDFWFTGCVGCIGEMPKLKK